MHTALMKGRGVGGQCRIKLLEEERERTTPISFRIRLLDTGKRRHVSKSEFRVRNDRIETAGMVKRERRVVNGKVPQHTPFHFLLVSSKILVLAESC